MTATAEASGASTPWWHWVVSVLGVLWNAFGAYDYFMSKTQGDAYLRRAGMTDAQIALVHGYPLWLTADWAIGVWGGLLGAVLLVARTRYALHAFVLSLAAFIMMLVYTYLLRAGAKMATAQDVVVNSVILALCAFFTWYSWRMAKRGVLR